MLSEEVSKQHCDELETRPKLPRPVVPLSPRRRFEAARVRVVKLEAALAALADFSGPEVDALTAALARAQVAASPPPVDVQLTECQQFIDRTVKRIEDLDRFREVESIRLQEARTGCNVCSRKPWRVCQCHLQSWRQMFRQRLRVCRTWFPSCRHSWQSPREILQGWPWMVPSRRVH